MRTIETTNNQTTRTHLKLNEHIVQAFAPNGVLHAAINLGNPILANQNPDTNEVYGISVDLAKDLANILNVPLELVVVKAAKQSVEVVKNGTADIGFFAVDPLRAQDIAFTLPYIEIEGTYLVTQNSPIQTIEQVDMPNIKIAVGEGSAYDLYLCRTLKNAQLIKTPTSPKVVDFYLEHTLDVAAGVRQQLEADALRLGGGLRVLADHFMLIGQAMGVSKKRPEIAAQFLCSYIELRKQQGLVQKLIAHHHPQGTL